MTDFYIKKGDVLPVIRLEIKDTNGIPVNLTGASVAFHYRLMVKNSTVNVRTTDIVDAANGIVQYSWITGDSSLAGVFKAEFIVTFEATGGQMSFPQDSFLIFEVEEDVG
jgi:hypothetical protein